MKQGIDCCQIALMFGKEYETLRGGHFSTAWKRHELKAEYVHAV